MGEQPLTSRKELFCHQCPQKKTLKVAEYIQASSEFEGDNVSFAKIFMLNHNVALNIETLGVVPTHYDEEQQKYLRVETVADLCDALKATSGFPPPSGMLPAVFIPFGKQLRGASDETLGWHISDINAHCRDHVGEMGVSRVVLIDSDAGGGSCSKVLLHEIGHAVGLGDVKDSTDIMGPCNPGSEQDPPIGCQPDRTDNLMPAKDVKKFCSGSF